MRALLLALLFALVPTFAVTQATPSSQTARQALIEMAFGTSANHLEKHLPQVTRNTLKKLGNAEGMSALDELSMFAMQAKMGGGKFETFDTGSTLLNAEDPREGSKVEITVERDDLIGDEDEIELSLHITKDNKEEALPFIPRFTFVMKSEEDVWRLNEMDVSIKVPLGDPAFLKSLEDRQRAQNEQMAIWSVRSIVTAESAYSQAQGSFACSLSALGDANKTPGHRMYLYDRQLMEGKKGGYVFAISSCDSSHYKLAAEPALPDSGQRAFCADEGGTIRGSEDGKATSCISNGETVEGAANAMPMQVIGGQTSAVLTAESSSASGGRTATMRVAPSGTTPKVVPMTPASSGTRPVRVRVSGGVMQGLKVSDVPPEYPQEAKMARVQGAVVLATTIGKDGTIQNLRVISSASPLLNQSALDAVKEWKYRPYILNGEPVEVDTTVTVNFTLR